MPKKDKSAAETQAKNGTGNAAAGLPLSPSELFEVFEIQFDAGPDPIFHGGELITGFLRVNLRHLTKIKKVTMQFEGRAVWLGGDSSQTAARKAELKKREGVHSENEKVYFNKDFVILERPPGHPESGKFEWNANFTYSLPFECPLPRGCETSYESPFGFIRYFARATLITEHEPPVKYFIKKAFSVVSPPELHQIVPPQSDPVVRKETYRFGACCCVGRLSAEVALPKSAYAPGENIIGTISVLNQNAWNMVDKIEVRFVDRAQRVRVEEPIPPDPRPASKQQQHNGEVEAVNGAAAVDGNHCASLPNGKEASKEKKGKRKAIKQKPPPTQDQIEAASNCRKQRKKGGGKCAVPVLAHRVIELRQLKKEDFVDKQSKSVTHTALFMTVPPVAPSSPDENVMSISVIKATDGSPLLDNTNFNGQSAGLMMESQQFSKILESPSTLTLKQRRQPFLRIDYALQVPITVHPIPIYERGIAFREFGGGAQPLYDSSDEAGAQPFGGPFEFSPLYPVYLDSPIIVIDEVPSEPIAVLARADDHFEMVVTGLDDCSKGTTHQVSTERETSTLPDGRGVETLTRTIETTTLSDGTEVVNRREERVIVETITTEDHFAQQQANDDVISTQPAQKQQSPEYQQRAAAEPDLVEIAAANHVLVEPAPPPALSDPSTTIPAELVEVLAPGQQLDDVEEEPAPPPPVPIVQYVEPELATIVDAQHKEEPSILADQQNDSAAIVFTKEEVFSEENDDVGGGDASLIRAEEAVTVAAEADDDVAASSTFERIEEAQNDDINELQNGGETEEEQIITTNDIAEIGVHQQQNDEHTNGYLLNDEVQQHDEEFQQQQQQRESGFVPEKQLPQQSLENDSDEPPPNEPQQQLFADS